MGSHSVACHPTEVRIPPLPPAEACTRFSDLGGMQGWVDLCYVKADRLGIEPATCKSQVQRPTAEPPRNTKAIRGQHSECLQVGLVNTDYKIIFRIRWRKHLKQIRTCSTNCRTKYEPIRTRGGSAIAKLKPNFAKSMMNAMQHTGTQLSKCQLVTRKIGTTYCFVSCLVLGPSDTWDHICTTYSVPWQFWGRNCTLSNLCMRLHDWN